MKLTLAVLFNTIIIAISRQQCFKTVGLTLELHQLAIHTKMDRQLFQSSKPKPIVFVVGRYAEVALRDELLMLVSKGFAFGIRADPFWFLPDMTEVDIRAAFTNASQIIHNITGQWSKVVRLQSEAYGSRELALLRQMGFTVTDDILDC